MVNLKNQLEGTRAWAHLVELEVNANTTAYFTSHPETLTWNSQVYMPVPLSVGEIEQETSGRMPQVFVDVSNFAGLAFRFAKDNDLSLNDVTIRLVNVSLTASGDMVSDTFQILSAAFNNEVGRFTLGFAHSYDAMGPRRTWNRRDHPSIPFNMRSFGIVNT